MTFITNTLNLGIVLLTIVSVDNRCCNGLNEVSYTFRYAIDEARVVTQHWEERRSDIVHGSYSFLEADGKIRVVEYQVNGKAGFRAVVTFRKPPTGYPILNHLKFPEDFRHPFTHAKPVAVISNELYHPGKTYPNLPE
ncbi:cuticle protein 18.6-like isoform X1 [Tribolium madens]|uniref:cuticle protein 18.6-like isoform X1 n=1 Tax=Tribolium madens TaxID=41895 RepID=UPI001CF73251|nr:cuticle protein 18.6-like isoform X1 [Tribolium madens]